MALCDFDMMFTFVLAGWPGSVHDMRMFKDARNKFGHVFPEPPQGIVHNLHSFLLWRTTIFCLQSKIYWMQGNIILWTLATQTSLVFLHHTKVQSIIYQSTEWVQDLEVKKSCSIIHIHLFEMLLSGLSEF